MEREVDMAVLRRSCLCGGVKYEITGPLLRLLNCHCSRCRKQHGAAFRSRARVNISDFKWVQGEELVRTIAPHLNSSVVFAGFAARRL
jgi:hypothetical protein